MKWRRFKLQFNRIIINNNYKKFKWKFIYSKKKKQQLLEGMNYEHSK